MEILLVLAVGAMCIGCFIVGAKVGQQVAKGETVGIPLPDPVKAIKEHKREKEVDRERSKVETILRNIEAYDGTSIGQEDVPQ